MKYDQLTVKQFKDHLVIIAYKNKLGIKNEFSGAITATTKRNILFLINCNTDEIIINYYKIISIIQPKIKN
jgi:hypothetical protein